jgi:uridylate kinase
MYKRVLLKLSGEALAGQQNGLNPAVLVRIAEEVKEVTALGVQVAIVVGGGNFIRGKFAEQMGIDRIQADYMGMLGTVINAIAIQGVFEKHGIETRIQTAIEMSKIAEPFIVRRAIRHLEKGRVVIFAAGTGSPYFSTDTTAALRASEIKADVILMAKNGTDGVYNDDPNKNKNAVKYDRLGYNDIIRNNLNVMDQTAIAMCKDNGLDLIVFSMNEKGNIKKAVLGEHVGTIVCKEENV